jgi:hypothetical protein
VDDARAAGIDVLMITDHHTMAAARHGWAGWQDGVLVIVGYEHSDPLDENHLLVFGLPQPLDPTLPADRYVGEAVRAGATVFAAHPVERRVPRGRIRAYPWTAGADLPFQGLEVWNFMSLWVERLSRSRMLLNYLRPGLTGERPDPETLALWDRCAETRPVAGIAGLDAHALKMRWGPVTLTLFSHTRHFQGPLTLVETATPLSRRDAPADTRLILTHLARGNALMGIPRLGPLDKVNATVDGRVGPVWGETFVHQPGMELGIEAPLRVRFRLVRAGHVRREAQGRQARFRLTEPGLYRVELLRRRGVVWALTNHFRVLTRPP